MRVISHKAATAIWLLLVNGWEIGTNVPASQSSNKQFVCRSSDSRTP